jgi:hypothetical protein
LEQLEDLTLPSSFTAATVSDLIADINAANRSGGANTIVLAANSTFELTKVDNKIDGPTGLPVISAGNNLTIAGNGAIIERSTVSRTAFFRLFDVASGAALTLQNLTLQNGIAYGVGVQASGGGIYNQGTLDLSGVVVQQNIAWGSPGKPGNVRNAGGQGQDAYGGGIWSSGVLTLENNTQVVYNRVNGGTGGQGILVYTYGFSHYINGGIGGVAFGGGVYVSGGTVSVTSATLSHNSAISGEAGAGGYFDVSGYGGGLCVAAGAVSVTNSFVNNNSATDFYGEFGDGGGLYVGGGTVNLSSDTIEQNTAGAAAGGSYYGYGGGIYINVSATLSLDSYTLANTINNTAGTGPNIYGTYILI